MSLFYRQGRRSGTSAKFIAVARFRRNASDAKLAAGTVGSPMRRQAPVLSPSEKPVAVRKWPRVHPDGGVSPGHQIARVWWPCRDRGSNRGRMAARAARDGPAHLLVNRLRSHFPRRAPEGCGGCLAGRPSRARGQKPANPCFFDKVRYDVLGGGKSVGFNRRWFTAEDRIDRQT